MKKYILSLLLVTSMFAETKVLEPVIVKTFDLQACTSCHGLSYEKIALGKSKVVKDMSIDDIEDSLIGYKNGTYGGVMKGLMVAQLAKYSEEDLMLISKQIKDDIKELK